MSLLFPRFNEFHPLFRVVDEFDRAARSGALSGTQQTNTRSFAPRFDVKETKDNYELHGELPGIPQSAVNIEWTNDNTLTISGHTERSYEGVRQGRVTEADDSSLQQNPTAEEEGQGASTSEGNDTTITKADDKKELSQIDEDRPRFWVSERSYGSFHRSFQFPTEVDQDNIKASLKNGILEISVPKVKAREPRKIQIQ